VEGDCVPLAITSGDTGNLETVDILGCRTGCDVDGDGSECEDGESCIQGGRFGFEFDFAKEIDAQGVELTCTAARCDAGNADCECGDSFECIQFGALTADNPAVCAKQLGMCGTPVLPITVAGITERDPNLFITSEEQICNQVEGTRLCDPASFYGDTENPGTSECITDQFFANPNDGVCFAFCGSPTIDRNNNNTLEAGEQGVRNNCPTGYECTADFGRTFLFAAGVDDAAGPFGLKACDPAACTAGEPCSDECGPGDTECVSFEADFGPVSLCLAPFSNCVDAVPSSCGDGAITGTEVCDGVLLGGATCPANTTGTVSCSNTCTLDTSDCVSNISILPLPILAESNIDPADDSDCFGFVLTAAQRVIASSTSAGCEAFDDDPRGRLLSVAGDGSTTELASDDDGGGGFCPGVTIDLDPGTYAFCIDGRPGVALGIQVTVEAVTLITTQLVVNTDVGTAEICTPFTLPQTSDISLATGTNGDLSTCPGDTELTLRTSTGTFIDSDDESGTGSCSLVVATSLPAGDYQSCVNGFFGTLPSVATFLSIAQ
jgi:hypothetical protein